MSESVRTALESIRERLVGDGSVSRAVDEIDALLLSLRADAWVSVKERLPEEGKDVLATDHGFVYVASWDKYGGVSGGMSWYLVTDVQVYPTHWLPLPPAPEVKK